MEQRDLIAAALAERTRKELERDCERLYQIGLRMYRTKAVIERGLETYTETIELLSWLARLK